MSTATRSPGRGAVVRTAAASPALRRMLIAYLFFNITEWAAWIATLVWAYGVGGVGAASAIAVVQLVPTALLATVIARWCSRTTRPRALLAGYAVQAVCLTADGLALLLAPPVVVVPTSVAACVAVAATRPVHYALLPDLADTTEELTASNSLSGAAEAAAAFIGPLGAGLLMVPWGPGGVVLVVAALTTLGVLLVRPLTSRSRASGAAGPTPSAPSWRRLLGEPAARLFGTTTFAEYLLVGSLDILLVVLALDVLELPQSGPGLLNSALGVGGVVGTAATVLLVGMRRLTPAILIGAVTAGIPIAVAGGARGTFVALVLVAAAGAGKLFYDVATRTLLQRSVSDRLLVGVFGMQEATMSAGLACGALLASVLIAAVGTSGAFVVVGFLLPAATLLVLPGLRGADARSQVAPEDVARLLAVPFLGVLSPLVVERLVREQAERSVPAGTWLMREGDPGDAFFVIASGRVEVTQHGSVLRELGPGDSFGELALLRDVPRTASVRALTPATFVVLGRDAFLGAVTGVPRSVQAADTYARRYTDLDPEPGAGA